MTPHSQTPTQEVRNWHTPTGPRVTVAASTSTADIFISVAHSLRYAPNLESHPHASVSMRVFELHAILQLLDLS